MSNQEGARRPSAPPESILQAVPAPTLLDRVLVGLDDRQKARVLELAVRLDIDQGDPLWLISIAIGQLQVLVEDAPDDWQELFQGFKGELEVWTQTHLETLQVVAQKSEAMTRLAENSQQLGTTLTTLVQICNALMQRLTTSELSSLDSTKAFKRLLEPLSEEVSELRKLVRKQQGYLDATLLRMDAKLDDMTGRMRGNQIALVLSGLALVGIFFIGWQQNQLIQTQQTIQQQLAE